MWEAPAIGCFGAGKDIAMKGALWCGESIGFRHASQVVNECEKIVILQSETLNVGNTMQKAGASEKISEGLKGSEGSNPRFGFQTGLELCLHQNGAKFLKCAFTEEGGEENTPSA